MAETMTTLSGVAFLRTPDACFEDLPGYPYSPSFIEIDGLRMHYLDVGPRDGPVALLMHGMPTWSFLNRGIIARLVAAGWRCIAADHFGFGRSDKPVDDAWYSIARHTAAQRTLIEHLDLQGVTLFCQDWGGPTGLAQAADMPERFERLVIMNTWLHHEGYDYSPAIHRWNAGWQPDGMFVTNIPERLSLGWFMMVSLGHMTARDMFAIIQDGVYPTLTPAGDAARRGYDAPFEGLGRAGHAGPRRFPLSLPFTNPEGGNAAAQQRHFDALLTWTRPVHFIWGGADNIFTEAWGREWAGKFPQATFDLLPEAGHFLQDTHGDAIADLFFARIAS